MIQYLILRTTSIWMERQTVRITNAIFGVKELYSLLRFSLAIFNATVSSSEHLNGTKIYHAKSFYQLRWGKWTDVYNPLLDVSFCSYIRISFSCQVSLVRMARCLPNCFSQFLWTMKKDLYLAQRLLEKIIRSITSTYYRPHSIQLIEDAVQQPGFANTGFHIVENIQYWGWVVPGTTRPNWKAI